ncbi:MAG: hypothetical protein H8E12_07945 [Rhodobacteraceae bacterium]|nr:hypothetical protein [Paracoccaceae bacterium]
MGDVFKKAIISVDDFVLVIGTSIYDNNKKSVPSCLIASVIAIGKYEMFLLCQKSKRAFKRPTENCYKISSDAIKLPHNTIHFPVLGDLVLSYSNSRYTQEKKLIGILVEIIDEPPIPLKATILTGETHNSVDYDTLIILETNKCL